VSKKVKRVNKTSFYGGNNFGFGKEVDSSGGPAGASLLLSIN